MNRGDSGYLSYVKCDFMLDCLLDPRFFEVITGAVWQSMSIVDVLGCSK